MKALLILLFSVVSLAQATTTSFLMVKMPLCLSDESVEFPSITIVEVPVLRASGAPDKDFGYICSEYIPPSAAKWAKPGNVNIATTYGIVISATIDSASQKLTITIDASGAHKPEGSPYSIKQVVDAVEKCVRLMEPQILPAYKKTVVRKLAAP